MTAAILLALAQTAVTAGRVDASSSDARIIAAAFVHVDFAQVSFVAGRRAIAGEIVDAVNTTAAIETRTLSAFVDVDLAMIARESFVALANVSLIIKQWRNLVKTVSNQSMKKTKLTGSKETPVQNAPLRQGSRTKQ